MIWVTWRQHRVQALICFAVLCAVAIYAIGAGIWMRHAFSADGIPLCLARSGGAGCPAAITSFADRFNQGVAVISDVPLLIVPGLLGIVVGATLLGQELERGTWRLAWSQTVPRNRWLVTKLGLVTGGLLAFGVAVTMIMTWYHQPLDQVTARLRPVPGTAEGLTFTASLLCAFGLAVLAGLLLRNTIGAMVTAYVAWEIPTTVVTLLGGPIRFPPPVTVRLPCHAGCPGASVSSVPPVTGHLGDYVLGVARSGGQLVVTYQPASRFWLVQLIGGGIYLSTAVTALGVALWLLHRRTT
ncbi:MAG: ABC transporter permease subunit [Streptosporangiaceae bacterium]|nr:ABC transporter permease subunit [Streptosporangiaceae bacterium]